MKQKKCRICKKPFPQRNSLHTVCSPKCAIVHANNEKLKARKLDTRERKQALKTKSDWLKEAQAVFNAYIRERDKNENCISCTRPPKKRNAGHYKSVGSHPELRFHPLNCAVQCEYCNSYLSGNQAQYRLHLLDRIGLKNMSWIEGPHQAQHWTIEDIQEIKDYYKEQLKVLKNE